MTKRQPEDTPSQATPEEPEAAFYCAEFGLGEAPRLYVGGLGVLAGDLVLEARDREMELLALGLMYRRGFVTSDSHRGSPVDPLDGGFTRVTRDGEPVTAKAGFSDMEVTVQAWEKRYGNTRLILLDTQHPDNTPEAQAIGAHLYDPEPTVKFREEWVLGLASIELLEKLEIRPAIYHLNEGTMAFAVAGLWLKELRDHPERSAAEALAAVKEKVVATKHTIFSGSGSQIERGELESMVGGYLAEHGISFEEFFEHGLMRKRPDTFSANRFLLDNAVRASGVSKLHVAEEKRHHPEGELTSITNGIYLPRWRAENMADASERSDAEIWQRHFHNKSELIAHINDSHGVDLNPSALTVVWARRITSYKRPELLFNDIDRLAKLVSDSERPVQFVLAGVPNPSDPHSVDILERILADVNRSELHEKVVYLPDYSMTTTRKLVAGADVWLNTPVRGQEACGTSGMKASVNGALQFSTKDGWLDEVDAERIGWVLPEEGAEQALYDTFEREIIPFYYEQATYPSRWTALMRQGIELVTNEFNAGRMLDEYRTKLYRPASADS